MVQQPRLRLEAAAEAGQAAVAADDAVARHDHGQRVAAVGGADRPGLAVVAEPAGLLAVADRLGERDRREARATPTSWNGEPCGSSGTSNSWRVPAKYSSQLGGRLRQHGVVGPRRPVGRADRPAVREADLAQRVAVRRTSVSGPIGVSMTVWQ